MLGWWKNLLLAVFVIGLIIFGSYMTIQHTNSTRAVSEMDGAIRSALLGQARGMGTKVGIDKDEFAGAVVEGIVNTQKNHKKTVQVDYVFLNAKGEKTEESEKIKSVQYRIYIINKKGEKQSRAVKNLALSEYGEDRVIDIDKTKVKYVNFEEGTEVARTATVTIPGLKGIEGVTVDNGTVSYTVNGETITIKVTGGSKTTKVTGSYTPAHTKYVSGQANQNYNKDGYLGTLTKYVEGNNGVIPELSMYVTGQPSSTYNSGGYKTKPGQPLVRYVSKGEYFPDYYQTESDSRSNSTGSFPSSIVKNGVTMTKDGSMTYYQTGGSYTPGYSQSESTTETNTTGSFPSSINKNGVTMYKSGSMSSYQTGGTTIPAHTKDAYATKTQSGRCINTGKPGWDNCQPKPNQPDSIQYNSGGYSGTLWSSDYVYEQVNDSTGFNWSRVWWYAGLVTKPAQNTATYSYSQSYVGTRNYPAVDTRTYWYTQNYWGQKYFPVVDTRQYAYQGMVYKEGVAGTGSVSYQGYVTKPAVDTRKEETTYKYGVTIRYK